MMFGKDENFIESFGQGYATIEEAQAVCLNLDKSDPGLLIKPVLPAGAANMYPSSPSNAKYLLTAADNTRVVGEVFKDGTLQIQGPAQ